MCLILHGDGHVTVKLLYEQIWPRVSGSELEFLECYDIILRSHAENPLDRLYVLSPHQPTAGSVFQLTHDDKLSHCDWVFEKKNFRGTENHRVGFVGRMGEDPPEYNVTRLRPEMREPSWWLPHQESDPGVISAFLGTGMTMAEVRFGDGRVIERFDPRRESETTYWLRLAFEPKIVHLTDSPIPFGASGASPLFRVQPCAALCPHQVLEQLSWQLEHLATQRGFREAAPKAREAIFGGVFRKPGTSMRVEEHRISLVTDHRFLVMNTTVEGDCFLLGPELSRATPLPDGCLVRSCYSGAAYYPQSDPLGLAGEVIRYLGETAYYEADAKTKETVSSALSSTSHGNISHIIEALATLGLLHRDKKRQNYFFINQEQYEDGKRLYTRAPALNELILGNRDREIRDLLYGVLPVPGEILTKREARSRFRHMGFCIFFDLAYCT